MRVPLVTMPTVGQQASPTSAPNLVQPDYSAARVTNTIGNALSSTVGQAVDAGIKIYEDADEVMVTSALNELDGFIEVEKGDYLKSQGLEASQRRAQSLEAIEAKRQKLIEGIKTDTAKLKFRARSASRLTNAQRVVESHVATQFEAAKKGQLKAQQDMALGRAEGGALDPYEFSSIEADVIKSIRGTQASAIEGDAEIADFQSRMVEAFVKGLVAQGRAEEAEAFLEKSRVTAGRRYAEVKAYVARATAGAQQERRIVEGAKLVNGTFDSLKMEANAAGEEYVDPEKLEAAIKLDETDPQVRGEVQAALEKKIREEVGRRRADTQRERDNANRADLEGKPIPGATLEYLKKYDPDFLLARQSRLRTEQRARRAANGSAADRRAQDQDDEAYRAFLKRRIIETPSLEPEQAEVEFVAYMKKKYGRDVGISIPERERGGLTVAEERKKATTKEGAQAKADAQRIEKVITAAARKGLKKGEKLDPAAINDEVGRDLLELEARVQANGGKPLDEKQWSDFERYIADDITISKPGRFFGTNEVNVGRPGQQKPEGPAAPPPTTQPKPSSTVTIRRKSDGKTRVVGAAEAARFLADPNFELVN